MIADGKNENLSARLLGKVPGWVIDLWIGFVLATFFVIRILGSSTGRNLLSAVGLRHGE